ncbi:hypothetical protein V8E36_001635, partial [Tilletia maclaganii]
HLWQTRIVPSKGCFSKVSNTPRGSIEVALLHLSCSRAPMAPSQFTWQRVTRIFSRSTRANTSSTRASGRSSPGTHLIADLQENNTSSARASVYLRQSRPTRPISILYRPSDPDATGFSRSPLPPAQQDQMLPADAWGQHFAPNALSPAPPHAPSHSSIHQQVHLYQPHTHSNLLGPEALIPGQPSSIINSTEAQASSQHHRTGQPSSQHWRTSTPAHHQELFLPHAGLQEVQSLAARSASAQTASQQQQPPQRSLNINPPGNHVHSSLNETATVAASAPAAASVATFGPRRPARPSGGPHCA